METLWQVVLAAMLFLQPPGQSMYSLVGVSKESPAPCAGPSLLCRPPRWNEAHQEWVIAETWEQGLLRYGTIAQSVVKVTGDDEWLRRVVLTMLYYESGFRRDIHSGVGDYARGDGKRSWCLGQIFLGRRSKRGRSLVGVDQAATDRCLQTVVKYIGKKKHANPRGVFLRYVGQGADPKHINARVHTFYRLESAPTELDAKVRGVLGIIDENSR